jgi:hypothetical protein
LNLKIFTGWKGDLVAVGLGLILSLGLVGAGETLLRVIRPGPPGPLGEPEAIRDAPVFENGIQIPNRHAKVIFHDSPEALERVTNITIDSFGRRVTLDPDPENPGRRFLAVIGCSFAFGVGVDDTESIPSQLATRLPGLHVYNFGISGSNPAEALRRLQLQGATPQNQGVAEREGYAVFIFIDDHIPRITGLRLHRSAPRFTLRNDRLEYEGEFDWVAHWQSRLRGWLSQSRLFGPWIGKRLRSFNPQQLRLTTKIFSELQSEARRVLGAKDLTVVIFPGEVFAAPVLVPALRAEGIRVLDYSKINLQRLLPGKAMFPHHHPTAESNRIAADLLAKDLSAEGIR